MLSTPPERGVADSIFQRLAVRLMPASAEEIERQSREWIVTCPKCGHERSYWEMGGIRYKAKSKGKRIGIRCPSCRKRSMAPVEHRPGAAGY